MVGPMPCCRKRGDGRDLTREWMDGRKGGKLVTNRQDDLKYYSAFNSV